MSESRRDQPMIDDAAVVQEVHESEDKEKPRGRDGVTNGLGSASSLGHSAVPATQVHAAALHGDKPLLQKLLAESAEHIDQGDQFGRTPLMFCVLADRPDCAEILIRNGAKVDCKDHGGRTALHWAAHKGNFRFLKLLISRGCSWREQDNEGQAALHLITKHKNTKCLGYLMKFLEPGDVDLQDKANRTALHWSASYGNEEAIKMLIKYNSNIGIPDIEGKTPLHWAAKADNDQSAVNSVRLLLEREASVINWQDYEGRTALHLAVADGSETIVQILIDVESSNVSALDNMFRTPLHWAAVLGHTKIVTMLLDHKAPSTSSDANGATPLHYAAQNNFAETVMAFLKHNSTHDDPDLEGRTALMWAAGKGADTVIKTIVEHGPENAIHATDKNGATALHAAAMSGHSSSVQILLDYKANVDAEDLLKHTPLFRAAELGHIDVVNTLIQGGANIEVVDLDGRSPLHWAALGGHACICDILMRHDIPPDIPEFAGRTPLQCAAYGGFINCMSLLMEKGADADLKDHEGMTALHWACSSGNLDAVKLLIENGAFPNHMEFNEDRFTPLDHALLNDFHDVAQYMIEQDALSITGIRDIASVKIQSYFRGYCVRKTFLKQKSLLMKHEQLRRDAAKKKEEESKKLDGCSKKNLNEAEGANNNNNLLQVTDTKESDLSKARSVNSVYVETDEPTQNHNGTRYNRSNSLLIVSQDICNSSISIDDPLPQSSPSVSSDLSVSLTSCTDNNASPTNTVLDNNVNNSNSNAVRESDAKRGSASSEKTDSLHQKSKKVAEQNKLVDKYREQPLSWRKQNNAAKSIQRAWRRHIHNNKVSVVHVAKTENRRRLGHGEDAWERQVAACTIQLAWRRYFRKKLLKELGGQRRMMHTWDPEVLAVRQTIALQKIYTQPMDAYEWNPGPRKKPVRPNYMKYIPSPAALSFNFAVDQYQPVSRRGSPYTSLTLPNLRRSSHAIFEDLDDFIYDADMQSVHLSDDGRGSIASHYSYNLYR
ncbi:inversin-like isoform X2 [Anneissia japonica]|uniref:inversin-like isoform X2 n=1 Tax=Anneissia japonica TaxID=1529436 RepID=UPI0014255811|nr:inversin-like isoform X2 [Anneissia japonica]